MPFGLNKNDAPSLFYVEFLRHDEYTTHTLNANDSSVVPGCVNVRVAFGDESSRLRVNTSSLSGEMRSAGFVEDDAMVIFITSCCGQCDFFGLANAEGIWNLKN